MIQLTEKEEWRDIKGYEGRYQISNMGRVISLERAVDMIVKGSNCKRLVKSKILKIHINRYGYQYVSLRKSGESKSKNLSIHQLVAKSFILNTKNYSCVNHKDENKLNNRYDNLEWCSEKYNNNFGKHNQNISNSLKGKAKSEDHILKIIESRNRFPVFQIDMKDGVILEEYRSMREAERSTGIFESNISQCWKGRTRSAGGFRWKYKNKTL